MTGETLDLLDRELRKRWFERRSPELDVAFEVQHAKALRIELRKACQLVGLLYISFGVMDAFLIHDMLPYILPVRITIGAIYVLAIWLQAQHGVGTRILEFQCAIGVFFGFAAWLFLAAQSVETMAALYYAGYGLIFMLVANLFFNLTFRFALLSSGLIAATFLIWATGSVRDTTYTVCFGSLYIFSFLLTVFLNFKYNRERYRVYINALRADIRQQEILKRGEELIRLSTTDDLTGLGNRRIIDGALRKLWQDSKASGKSFGVILIDVDYFKSYNDCYGHQQGDRCLARVSQAMLSVAKPFGFTLGRFGGEEFAALFQAVSVEQVAAFAEETRRAVESLQIVHAARRDHFSGITVSVGAAFSGDVAADKPERMVTAADVALYVAKGDGRNCVRTFDRRMLESDAGDTLTAEMLRTAIADQRISAVFQPIVDVTSGLVWGAEALMRLKDPQGRSVSPETFIPVAERTGVIMELGEWMLHEACDLLATEPALPVISVNVSSRQIEDPNFVDVVEAIVRAAAIDPSRLALEITEGGQISGNPQVVQLMDRLSAIGIRVWLDDFGTGFAGLTCLSELRFDMVKIDRFFVQSSDTPRGAKLLKNIIDLVSSCAQKTIVEGVEDAYQIELVASFGVELFQGYHLGRPMPRHELVQRLADQPAVA
ncbi:GGDEF domain-containing phosphodiesterase [Methylobacterium sp. WL6]|uniref:putative bifunctional diguanylate cyclase/phosphodiesterase n=1 Tax=Methylobacterium sp. WL6 TaxID=2603901 RepID=UPI0011CA67C7|nr:GGDEF domain-containing phosphodiesterase [Methylobacterium sp. WL6]TXN73712.1 EAL domain-containing protein [Methylobacterium sp. WL6]